MINNELTNSSIVPVELKEALKEIMDDPAKRVYACEKNIALFSLYYFAHYHFYEMPAFHLDMYNDMLFNNLEGAMWIMFRESAKTSLAKIGLIHTICYERKKFPIWISYDQRKAASNLYNVALELQLNQRIIADFGQLFYEPEFAEDEDKVKFSKKKSIKEFVTSNKIKVLAYSTGMNIRGENFGEFRPDLEIFDDIENSDTITSEAKTNEVITFLDEALTGSSSDCSYLILANRLAYNGSIVYVEDKVKKEPDWVVRDFGVEDNHGKILWPQKYVKTDKEALEVNKGIEDRKRWKVSLESKERKFGYTVYNREMLNIPLTDAEREFKLAWLQKEFIPEDVIGKTVNRYVTIDVADSKARQKKDPDYTATTVVDIDGEGNWYVQLAHQARMNAPELIDWLFYLWVTYKPVKIGIEKKSLEDQVMPYIRQRSDEKQVFPVVTELKHGGTKKEDRIRGALQGRAEHGKIYFKKNPTDHTNKLKTQLYDFPKAKHDDLSDTLAYIEQIGFRPFSRGKDEYKSPLHKDFYEYKAKQKAVKSVRSRILNL